MEMKLENKISSLMVFTFAGTELQLLGHQEYLSAAKLPLMGF